MTALATEQSVWDAARELLATSEIADPHELAKESIASLSPETLEELALRGWGDVLHAVARMTRVNRGGQSQSAAWDRVRDAHESGQLDVLRRRFPVDGEWKFLGDCTVSDLTQIAAEYERREQENRRMHERFQKLIRRMKTKRAVIAGDLGAETVEKIFDA